MSQFTSSPSFEPQQAGHCARSELAILPLGDLQRFAYDIARLIETIPQNPSLRIVPKAYAVGSFVTNPRSARDLDIEVFGITWNDLQVFFTDLTVRQLKELGIRTINTTEAGPDGRIERNNPSHFGNAFVAVWIELQGPVTSESDRKKVSIQVPLRVNALTDRYNLRTRDEIPEATLEEACERRIRPFESVSYFDPLTAPYGTVIQVNADSLFMARGKEARAQFLDELKRDPLVVYRSLRAIARSTNAEAMIQFLGEQDLRAACAGPLPTDVCQLRPGRFAAELWRGFYERGASLDKLLIVMERFGVLERDFPGLKRLKENLPSEWDDFLLDAKSVHETACAQLTWSSPARFGLVAARLASALERQAQGGTAAADEFEGCLFPKCLPWDAPPSRGVDPIDPHDREFYQAFLRSRATLK